MHYCITCKKELLDEMFYKNKFKKSGLQDHCKEHQRKFVEGYELANNILVLLKARLRAKIKTGSITQEQYNKEIFNYLNKEK